MSRTDLSLSLDLRDRAPYRSLCVEVLMVALRDRRKGHRFSAEERKSLERWAGRVGLSAWILDADGTHRAPREAARKRD